MASDRNSRRAPRPLGLTPVALQFLPWLLFPFATIILTKIIFRVLQFFST